MRARQRLDDRTPSLTKPGPGHWQAKSFANNAEVVQLHRERRRLSESGWSSSAEELTAVSGSGVAYRLEDSPRIAAQRGVLLAEHSYAVPSAAPWKQYDTQLAALPAGWQTSPEMQRVLGHLAASAASVHKQSQQDSCAQLTSEPSCSIAAAASGEALSASALQTDLQNDVNTESDYSSVWSAAVGDDRCNPRAAVRREDPALERHKELMKQLAAEAVAVQQYACREKESILDAAQLLELAPVYRSATAESLHLWRRGSGAAQQTQVAHRRQPTLELQELLQLELQRRSEARRQLQHAEVSKKGKGLLRAGAQEAPPCPAPDQPTWRAPVGLPSSWHAEAHILDAAASVVPHKRGNAKSSAAEPHSLWSEGATRADGRRAFVSFLRHWQWALVLAFLPAKLLVNAGQSAEQLLGMGWHPSLQARVLLEQLEGYAYWVIGAAVGLMLCCVRLCTILGVL